MAATLPIPESDQAAEADAPTARPTTTLASLAPGETADVSRVDTARPIGQRLVDLGFVPGTRVRVIRRAPLGDPVTYEVRGSRLCLRRSEARQIEVARCAAAPAAGVADPR